MRSIAPVFLLLTFAACNGDSDTDKSDTGATGDDDDTVGDDDDDTAGDDDDDTSAAGFSIEATAIDASTQAPATEGLCVDLLDPSPALLGEDPELLMSTTVGANGAILFEGVETESTLGLLVSVKDCDTLNSVTFTSATGIPYPAIENLGDGDVLANQTAFVIPMTMLDGMQASAAAVGYTGDLETEGMLFGFTFDSTGTPVAGATVTCGTCGPTYYLDGDSSDGLFSTGTTVNAATDATGGAGFIIPAGPVGQYTAEDGGTHTWETQLNGSNPGAAAITAFFGM